MVVTCGCNVVNANFAVLILIAVVTASTLTATAEASAQDWPMFHHNLSHSGNTGGNLTVNSAKLLWNYTTHDAVISSPSVSGGYVVFGSRDYNVYCLNASSGELLWNFKTGSMVKSSAAIDDGRIFIGSEDGWLYCFDLASGIPLWGMNTGGPVKSCPAVADGRVYVGSGAGDIYCFNASDGEEIWVYPTSYGVNSSPSISNGVVYVACDDYFVYALNATTGVEVWREHTGSQIDSPCINNGYVYTGSYDGYVCALNASTGAKIWQYQTEDSVTSSPAAAYGCVFVGSEDNNVYCLNAFNGNKIWRSPTGYWVRSSPAVAGGNVYVGSEDYSVYCFDAFTGGKKWSFATGDYVDSSPAIADGNLYVGSNDGKIYAFSIYASDIQTVPLQATNPLPWTTVVFAVLACVTGAIIVFMVTRSACTAWRSKQNTGVSGSKLKRLFTAHIDVLCIIAILACSSVLFVNLGSGHLWRSDEQTYSQWAYHMYKTGDYLNPRAFGDDAMWIGKPPLFMWLMSLSYQVFGVSNFATRLWSPVFGALSLVLVFYLGKVLYNRYVGLLSAVVLGTFTTFYSFSRLAMTDIAFLCFFLASMYFFVLSEKTSNANRNMLLSGVFFGLALMTKQVVALLIPLLICGYLVAAKRSLRFLLTKRFAMFLGVALAVFSPWIIYMTISFGADFLNWFFIYVDVTRAVAPIEGHTADILFYFNYLFANERLWTVLVPFGAGLCLFNLAVKRSKSDGLILGWMAVVVLAFSLIQTKLEWYLLPAFPAFAIAISALIVQAIRKAITLMGPFISRLKHTTR